MKANVRVTRQLMSGGIRDEEERAIRFNNQKRASDLMMIASILGMVGVVALVVVVAVGVLS